MLGTLAGAGAGALNGLDSQAVVDKAANSLTDYADAKGKMADARQHLININKAIKAAQKQSNVTELNSSHKITDSIQY